jgi:(1->4)-alpha-D-glucan 1-alpha-D-glucosylmutase
VTSWINPNTAYETALSAFIYELLAPRESNLFLPDLQLNVATFAWYGALNGIAVAVLKCLSPGVPDFYQGHESIELRLVDPDNRRPVDWPRRLEMMALAREIGARDDAAAALRDLLARITDGRAKFFATWCALGLRRRHEALLRDGAYLPLEVRGEKAAHVVAFARRDATQWAVAIAIRLPASLGLAVGEAPVGEIWGDTHIVWPDGAASANAPTPWLDDAITARRHRPHDGLLRIADVLRDFPAAALCSTEE